MDLTCYVYPGWKPWIRPASSRRDWMDGSPESFAYRCLPLNIANAHGWEVLSPCGFSAEWNGGPEVDDVVVRLDGPAEPFAPVALFGQGVLTFHVQGLFRTPPGIDLWVGGPPNAGKDAIAPLGGVVETDWSPFTFTMNWRFTRPGQAVRFEAGEPFCLIFPLQRGLAESVRPRIADISEEPELKRQFEAWSASRDAFQARMASDPPAAPADKWQKFYYRGVDAEGAPGPSDHRSKLRLAEFEGADRYDPPPQPAVCPVNAAPPRRDSPGAEKLEWTLRSLERLRSFGSLRPIPRKRGLSAEAFRDDHYAANWPVVMAGEIAHWPAVRQWTPDYLRRKVGALPVEVQTGRNADADYERRMAEHRTVTPFDAFIEQVTAPGAANDTYLTAYNSASNQEAFAQLAPDLGFLDRFLSRQDATPHGMPWIGAAGSFTPLHHDLTNNLLLQVVGRKIVLMAAPGETPRLYNDHHVYSRVRDLTEPGIVDRFPKLDGVRVHRVVLEPGDALFIPLGWWHQVTALDFSVSITHTNFHWPNDFYADYPQN
jgi:Family of unknown function (DUF6065)/Cupin-like domain